MDEPAAIQPLEDMLIRHCAWVMYQDVVFPNFPVSSPEGSTLVTYVSLAISVDSRKPSRYE